jgi:dolichol-phosphate mannosyltransferase
VIATYNELESLPKLVDDLVFRLPDAAILVIDDNSPDGTGDWCNRQAAMRARFSVIHRPGKMGLGTATTTGLQSAVDRGFEFVATLDADLSHSPASLANLYQEICSSTDASKPLDVVIGSRYVANGSIVGWPWYRHLSSRVVNAFARCVLRLPVRDSSSAMRIYRVTTLARIDFHQLQNSGYAYLQEILMLLKRQQAIFSEIPIHFVNRQQGRSKVDLSELARSLVQIARLLIER